MLRPRSRFNTWRLHHDNAPAHRAQVTTDFLKDLQLQIVKHPTSPFDFGLFPYIKKQLKGRRFASDDELLAVWWDQACADVLPEKWQAFFTK